MRARFVFEAVNTRDKYYAPPELLEHVMQMVKKYVPLDQVTEIVEPAAGDGAFMPYLNPLAKQLGVKVFYYDLEPDNDSIPKQDFLNDNPMKYKPGRLIITGPPYGTGSYLWEAFAKKAAELADYVVFISPVYFYNMKHPVPELNLIKSDYLGKIKFYGSKTFEGVPHKVKTCVNVYERINPIDDRDELKAQIEKDFFIKEFHKSRMKDEGWEYYIGAYGYAVGTFMDEPKFEVTLAVDVKNEKMRKPFEEFMSDFREKFRQQIKDRSTTTEYLSKRMFIEYLKEYLY